MRYAESRKYWVVPGTNYLKYKGIAHSMSESDNRSETRVGGFGLYSPRFQSVGIFDAPGITSLCVS